MCAIAGEISSNSRPTNFYRQWYGVRATRGVQIIVPFVGLVFFVVIIVPEIWKGYEFWFHDKSGHPLVVSDTIKSLISGERANEPEPPPIVALKTTIATTYFHNNDVNKQFVLNMPGDDNYSHVDIMSVNFFTTIETAKFNTYILAHNYNDAFKLIDTAKNRLERERKFQKEIIAAKTNWFIGVVIISTARVENDLIQQHSMLLAAARYFTDSLAAFEGSCPASYYLWVMSLYSVATKDIIVDKKYFLNQVDATNVNSFKNQNASCVYSLNFFMTLAENDDDDKLVDAIVNDIAKMADWDTQQSARIYLYMRAADYYIYKENFVKLAQIINLINEVYSSGILTANIYRLYLISLGYPDANIDVGGDPKNILTELSLIKTYIMSSRDLSGQIVEPTTFDSLEVSVEEKYVDATLDNIHKHDDIHIGSLPASLPSDTVEKVEQGNAIAQNNLGTMYRDGAGVPPNDKIAIVWFRKSAGNGYGAQSGNAIAQNNLGLMYEKGRGVAPSDKEAARWFLMAAKNSNAWGQNNIGVMYRDGRGVPQSDKDAFAWFQESAKNENAEGQYNLAFMYEKGRGVAPNASEAAKWYLAAKKNGRS